MGTSFFDTIPEPFRGSVPTVCKYCGSPLVINATLEHLYCPEETCPSKLARRLESMTKAFGIKFIGEQVAWDIVESLKISNLYELFDLSEADFCKVGNFKAGMASKVYKEIHTKRNVPWASFLLGVQLPRVGKGTVIRFANEFPDIQSLKTISVKKATPLLKNQAEIVVDYIHKMFPVIEALYSRVYSSEALSSTKEEVSFEPNGLGMFDADDLAVEDFSLVKDLSSIGSCCVTGPLSVGRPLFIREFSMKYNIIFVSSLTSKTAILITNVSSTTTKAKAAEKFGTTVMTEEKFRDFVSQELRR